MRGARGSGRQRQMGKMEVGGGKRGEDVLCRLQVALGDGDAGELVEEGRVEDVGGHALGVQDAEALRVVRAGGGEVAAEAVEVAEGVVDAAGLGRR